MSEEDVPELALLAGAGFGLGEGEGEGAREVVGTGAGAWDEVGRRDVVDGGGAGEEDEELVGIAFSPRPVDVGRTEVVMTVLEDVELARVVVVTLGATTEVL